MKKSIPILELSDDSLIHLLNFIVSMIGEDRKNALQHHDTLAAMLEGTADADGLTQLEIQLLLNDMSAALTNFLKNSAQSTEQTIKVAKLMADHLTKIDRNAALSEEDRDAIEEALSGFNKSESDLTDIKTVIQFDLGEESA